MDRPKTVPISRGDDATKYSTLQYEASVLHPVQEIQNSVKHQEVKNKRQMLALTYGAAMPMRLEMHEQILSQFRRLPGLPSSHLALQTLSFRDETIDVEDYMGRPEDSPYMPEEDTHEVMEKALGIRPPSQL